VLGLPAPPADAARTLLAQGYRAAVDWLAAFDWARLGLPAFTAGTHRAALWLAAAAVALAAVCVHGAATEVGVSRRRALLAALLGATCPAVAVAATTIHVHALFLLLGALAAWLAAALAQRGGFVAAAPLGLVFGGACWLLPAGVLLPFAALPLLLRQDPTNEPTRLRRALLGGSALALGAGLAWLAQQQRGELAPAMPTLAEVGSQDLRTLGRLTVYGAGLAFLPLSLVAVAALWSHRHHRQALLLVAGAAVAVVLGCHLNPGRSADGWFLLPFAPLAAVLAARWLPVRLSLLLVLVAAGLSGTKLWRIAEWEPGAAWAAGVRELAGGKPFALVIGPQRDAGFALAALPAGAVVRLWPTVDDAAGAEPFVAALRARAAASERLWLTAEAEQTLRDPAFGAAHPGASGLLAAIEAGFATEPATAQGFAGKELRPR